jgi:hypothetical protein
MKYIRFFKKYSDYQSYLNSEDMLLPNASYIMETNECFYNPYIIPIPQVGDVVYYNKEYDMLKTISYEKYNTSLGIAVGVIVISGGFLPDGKPRMIALNQPNIQKSWDNSDTLQDTNITNHNTVITTPNHENTSTVGGNPWGYLSSDKFTNGTQSVIDPNAKYYSNASINLICPPYLNDGSFNQDFGKKEISGVYNAMSDYEGENNTDILVSLGDNYQAANYAKQYQNGVCEIDWYLPSCGEFSIMFSRLKQIDDVIKNLGGETITQIKDGFWTSTEYGDKTAYRIDIGSGGVNAIEEDNGNYLALKNVELYVRSFAKL